MSKELYDFLAPAQAPDELGRLGSYRVLQVLGVGGMGVVFLAQDPQLARPVASGNLKCASMPLHKVQQTGMCEFNAFRLAG